MREKEKEPLLEMETGNRVSQNNTELPRALPEIIQQYGLKNQENLTKVSREGIFFLLCLVQEFSC